ncbi:hypothetical protein I1H34_08620 [Acaryochloris marina S15]|nr:hypothetical protein I1H34_08620 [Acaryochloris marina S15]
MLDAILSPDWEDRYYSFDTHWHPNEQLGSMRDGSGDFLFALFSPNGCFLKGFAHESVMSPYQTEPPQLWPGLFENIPSELQASLDEPAFSIEDTTFCLWRQTSDSQWQRGSINFPEGSDPDGSMELLTIFDHQPNTYQQWAEAYYECSIDTNVVQQIYQHFPLTQTMIHPLNPELLVADLLEDIQEIGYPVAVV